MFQRLQPVKILALLICIVAFASSAFAAPGALDTTYGSAGWAKTALGTIQNDSNSTTNDVIQQADGKLVAAGSTCIQWAADFSCINYDIALARFNLDGSPDTSFDDDGKVSTSVSASSGDFANAVIQQADGKLVVAGSSAIIGSGNSDFLIIRYNSDGTLDTSFDVDGKIVISLGSSYERAYDIVQQADGKLVVAGGDKLLRLNADGSLDTSFDVDGVVVLSNGSIISLIQQADGKLAGAGSCSSNFYLGRLNANGSLDMSVCTDIGTAIDSARSIIQQADGKLVVAGAAQWLDIHWYARDGAAIVRYNLDGTLDATFGGGGKLKILEGADRSGLTVIQQADGKLLATGQFYINSQYEYDVVRYNSNGTLETGFGRQPALADAKLIQQADGKLVVAGGNMATLLRYNLNGSLDGSFDGDGSLYAVFGASLDQGNSVIQQSDGKLVMAGASYNGANNDFAFTRYNSNGSLDLTFDGDGKLFTNFGSGNDQANAVIQQSDGKLVAAGFSYNGSNNDFALARYNSNGSLDVSFGIGGKVVTPIGPGTDEAYSLIQQADGKLVAAGISHNGSHYDFAVVRYNSNGSLDTTFDGDGIQTTSVGLIDDYAQSLIQQTDGKLVVAGYSCSTLSSGECLNDFAVVRYNTDGSLDAAFDGDGKVTTAIGANSSAYSIIQQTDGKLVVAGKGNGAAYERFDFALARYNADGSLDTLFDGDGKLTTPYYRFATFGPSESGGAYAVIQQADGKLVAAGWGRDNSYKNQFALARYNASNGSLDTSFDGDGIRVVSSYGSAKSLLQQKDGKLVAAGSSDNTNYFLSARFESGQLDADSDGVVDGLDNCPSIANPLQTDTNANGIGDACENMSQTITVITPAPASAALNSSFPVAATASSGLPVAITVSGGCTIASGVVTMMSAVTACTVNFDQSGNVNYAPATQITSNTAAIQATQTISITTPAPASAAFNSTFPVAAAASSGLPVAITVSGGCTITAGVVTMTSATNACTVNYDQAGDANYFAATQVTSNTAATQATQVITVTAPFAPAFAAVTDTFPVAATASSGLLVAITSSGSCSGSGMSSATVTMLGTVCTVNFNQAGDVNYLAAPLVINNTNAPVTIFTLDGTQKGARMNSSLKVQ